MTLSDPQQRRVLKLLVESSEPLSGRRVAEAIGVSPTTANRLLGRLADAGAVVGAKQGRAIQWSPVAGPSSLLDELGDAAAERTVLIATALPLEFAAMRRQLLNPKPFRSRSGTSYVEGLIPGEHLRWRVLLAEFGMGNASAAARFATGISEMDVDLVAFVGVAGGLKPDDDKIGDVIVADRVYNATSGKDVESEGHQTRLVRPTSYMLQHRLRELALGLLSDSDWGHATPRKGGQPKARIGPIAAVDAVQASSQSAQMKVIRSGFNDAVAIDMESLGAFAAATLHGIPAIAVRGISDFVDGKRADVDAVSQPKAASNAARLLADLLSIALQDDVRARARERSSDSGSPVTEQDSIEVPPGATTWLDRLRRSRPELVDRLLADFAASRAAGASVGTWLARLLHRPPDYLRSDPTGDAWAAVAHIAVATNSARSGEALRHASDRALALGDHLHAELHAIQAELFGLESSVESGRAAARRLEVLEVSDPLKPFQQFYVHALRGEASEAIDCASEAIASLGYLPNEVGLDPVEIDPAGLDEPVAAILAAGVLLAVARIWVHESFAQRALVACRYAMKLYPQSTSARLLHAQIRMSELALSLTKPFATDISGELREIESAALEVRSMRASWGGDTEEALALAGQALSHAGNPRGALRLLREPPFGTASISEAKSTAVARVSAVAALMLGDSDLVLEFAKKHPRDAQASILRASALAQMPNMRTESIEAFESAIAQAGDDADVVGRALFGLSQFAVVDESNPVHKAALTMARALDADRAELILANNDLSANRLKSATRRANSVRGSVLAAEIASDAMMRSGRQREAVELLDTTGQQRGELQLRARAMVIAVESELDELAGAIASSLLLQADGEIRVRALQARLTLAFRSREWREALKVANTLLESALDRVPAAWTTQVHWAIGEAHFHLGHHEEAWEAIREHSYGATDRHQAGLIFAIVRGFGSEGRSVPTDLYDAAISMGSAFVEDEEIAAEAVKVLLLAEVQSPPTEDQVSRLRTLIDDYFTKNEDTEITRLGTEEGDLDELLNFLKEEFEPREQLLKDFTEKAWLGQIPLALLSRVAHRGYAETLIKQSLGCHVVLNGSTETRAKERTSAESALESNEVVIDTSALVLGAKLGVSRSKLLGLFERVHFSSTLNNDLRTSRSSLALRSTAAIGWDARAKRPSLTEHGEALAESWAVEADQVHQELRHLSVVDDRQTPDISTWNAAFLLAKKLEMPLWADDVAIRRLAQFEGIQAFSTADLIEVARGLDIGGMPSQDELEAKLIAERIVDANLTQKLSVIAESEAWQPAGYAALAMSRPASWGDLRLGLAEYQRIVRELQQDAGKVGAWAAAAGRGLATAVPSGSRPDRVGALLAWTAMNAEPMLSVDRLFDASEVKDDETASVLAELINVGLYLQRSYFDSGDVVTHIVRVLSDVLTSTIPTTLAAKFLVRAISALPLDIRDQAMAAFWNSSAAGP